MKKLLEILCFVTSIGIFPVVLSYSKGRENEFLDQIHFYHYPDTKDVELRKEMFLDDKNTISRSKLKINGTKGSFKFLVPEAHIDCSSGLEFPLSTVAAYLKSKEKANKVDMVIICIEYAEMMKTQKDKEKDRKIPDFETVIKTVGKGVSKLIDSFEKQGFLDLKDVHFVGLGLGAHIAGRVGFEVPSFCNTTQKLGRISGLDPTRTESVGDILDLDILLDHGDADFVDVYHTDMDKLGFKGKIGQVDFYPDGGLSQKRCKKSGLGDILGNQAAECSHAIAGKYWRKSIDDLSMEACQAKTFEEFRKFDELKICRNPIPFGDGTFLNATGRYYLDYPEEQSLPRNQKPKGRSDGDEW